MTYALYFTLKAFFILKIFNFLSWLLCLKGKQREKKAKVNLKAYDVMY